MGIFASQLLSIMFLPLPFVLVAADDGMTYASITPVMLLYSISAVDMTAP